MTEWQIALGFYQNPQTAEVVLKKLKKARLRRLAAIQRAHEGQLSIRLFGIPPFQIPQKLLKRFERWVIRDETLIIVQVHASQVPQALKLLRHVESGHPLSFLLRKPVYTIDEKEKESIISEPLTLEQSEQSASQLAAALQNVSSSFKDPFHLLERLRQNEKTLMHIGQHVAEAEFVEQTITSSAEWFLDNIYVIQNSIEEVKRNLPKKYYRELPKVTTGPFEGFLRIYLIAKQLLETTAS